MKILLLALLFSCLTACAGTNVTKSSFDGSTQIRSRYGWCDNGVRMLLSWHSNMPADTIRLDVAVDRGVMAAGPSLHLNIDGKLVDLIAQGRPTYVSDQPMIEDSYLIDPQTVDAIINAKKVLYRLDLVKDYTEGALRDDPAGAIANFREFMATFRQLSGNQNPATPA